MTCNKSCKQCDRIGKLSFQFVCTPKTELGLTHLAVLDNFNVCGYFCKSFCKDKFCTKPLTMKKMEEFMISIMKLWVMPLRL